MSITDIMATLKWWLALEVIGLLALPLAFRVFRWLPGRGYALAKALGLLLAGYFLWMLSSLGFARNTTGGAALALLLVAVLAAVVYARSEARQEGQPRAALGPWLREHLALIVTTEVLFALVFAGWTLVRANNPAISATEKPMEFAFLNSILRDPGMPPADPWLSGYAISYYYFGYVIVAMLTNLTGIVPGVAFNLAVASLMALAAVGAFGVAYELVAAHVTRSGEHAQPAARGAAPRGAATRAAPAPSRHSGARAPLLTGVLAALLLVVVSNWEMPLEYANKAGMGPAAFWQALDIKDLTQPGTANPDRWLSWWRASRVVHDCTPQSTLSVPSYPCAENERFVEVIDEFPYFSFLLADMHPHVLSLPFTLLAVAFGLVLLQRAVKTGFGADAPGDDPRAGELQALAALVRRRLGEFGAGYLLLGAVIFGALGFLNTWDFPAYLAIATLALGCGVWRVRRRLDVQTIGLALLIGALMGALGYLLYLPFWIGFRSQLAGLLPNLIYPTRMPQFLVFFGPFIVIDLFFLIYLGVRLAQRGHYEWRAGLAAGFGTLALLWLGLVLVVALSALLPAGQGALDRVRQYLGLEGSTGGLVTGALIMRAVEFWLPLFLALGLALVAAALASGVAGRARGTPAAASEEGTAASTLSPSTVFVLLLMGMSILVVLFPEFFYLRDLFGSRINTIFKFYYQAWALSAIAAAFAVYFLFTRLAAAPRAVFALLAASAIALGLVYPLKAGSVKLAEAGMAGRATLDGLTTAMGGSPDYQGIQWLNANVPGQPVILEVPGQPYSDKSRISAATGLPTVLGWQGHEDQWRGTLSAELKGTRAQDVETIYTTRDWKAASDLLDRYRVEYVYVGPLERNLQAFQQNPGLSRVALEKFAQNWQLVYESPDRQVQIYRRVGGLAGQ